MAPVAAAAMVMIASMLMFACLIGAVGGVVTGLSRRDLVWGVLGTLAIYFALSPSISRIIGPLVGLLPLVITFTVAALSTGGLQTRMPRPLAGLGGLVLGLGAGFLYMLPLRFDIWTPM